MAATLRHSSRAAAIARGTAAAGPGTAALRFGGFAGRALRRSPRGGSKPRHPGVSAAARKRAGDSAWNHLRCTSRSSRPFSQRRESRSRARHIHSALLVNLGLGWARLTCALGGALRNQRRGRSTRAAGCNYSRAARAHGTPPAAPGETFSQRMRRSRSRRTRLAVSGGIVLWEPR